MVPTESYLKFDLKVNSFTANNAFRFDSCGAHGLIQRIRVFSGSNLLEDIDNYGMLSKMLFDVQMPTDSCYGKYNILAGTRSDMTTVTPTFDLTGTGAGALTGTQVTNALSNIKMSAYCSNSGLKLNSTQIIAANASQTGGTYCLNLISLVGSLCNSVYLPLFAMQSAPLRVEIQLVDQIYRAMSALVAGTFTITNCELYSDTRNNTTSLHNLNNIPNTPITQNNIPITQNNNTQKQNNNTTQNNNIQNIPNIQNNNKVIFKKK
jgi:hypothetical protein